MSYKTNRLLEIFEGIFSVASLIHLSSGIIPLLIIKGASEGDGIDISSFDFSLVAKVYLLIYLCTIFLLTLRWKKVINVLTEAKFIWLFVLFSLCSFLWSESPDKTFRFGIYGIGTTLFGLYLATRYTIKQQLNILAWTFGTIVLLSVIFVVAIPQYGVMASLHEGAVRGIYTHKNQFGIIAALGAFIFLLKAMDNREKSWILWIFLIVTVALGFLSASSTSIGNMLLMLLLCIFYRIFRWQYELLVSTVLSGLVLGVSGLILFLNLVGYEAFFDAIGKDATLSSRTEIWKYVWEAIQLKPLEGYGVSAFWNGLEGASRYVELVLRAEIAYAHNGFLDILLATGFIGLGLFLISFCITTGKALFLLRQTNTIEGFWPLLFLTFLILSNVAEGTLAALDNIYWAIYAMVNFSLIVAEKDKYLISD